MKKVIIVYDKSLICNLKKNVGLCTFFCRNLVQYSFKVKKHDLIECRELLSGDCSLPTSICHNFHRLM